MKRVLSLLIMLVMLAGLLSSCAPKPHKNSDGKLQIVCTLFPQYDFVRGIVGNKADVSLMLPAGAESHSFEPTPADMISLKNADLFIYIGEEMETWIGSILPQLDDNTSILNISKSLKLTLESHEHHLDEDDTKTYVDTEEKTVPEKETESYTDQIDTNNQNGEKVYDPHIWTDPAIAVRMTELISDVIIELDGVNTSTYSKNAKEYILELWGLDAKIRSVVADGKRNEIVYGSRFALKNFVKEYDLTYIAAFDSCTEETEPSAAAVARIIDEINKNDIPVVFYEELIEPSVAQSLAKETGATPLLFHTCHNLSAEDFKNGETYISLMQHNIENLKIALN